MAILAHGDHDGFDGGDMSGADFAHLHLHTQYSFLDGAIRMKDLIKRTTELGMSAVAVTDHGTPRLTRYQRVIIDVQP